MSKGKTPTTYTLPVVLGDDMKPILEAIRRSRGSRSLSAAIREVLIDEAKRLGIPRSNTTIQVPDLDMEPRDGGAGEGGNPSIPE